MLARILFIVTLALALVGAQRRPTAAAPNTSATAVSNAPAPTPQDTQQTTPKITDAIVQKGAPDPSTDDEPEYMCPMDKDVSLEDAGQVS